MENESRIVYDAFHCSPTYYSPCNIFLPDSAPERNNINVTQDLITPSETKHKSVFLCFCCQRFAGLFFQGGVMFAANESWKRLLQETSLHIVELRLARRHAYMIK